MSFKKFRNRKWVRIITSRYMIILILFVIWMFFFDTNSFLIHNELNDDIKVLQNNADFYQKEIDGDKEFIKRMEDSNEMEKFARERYFLKKENEDIFLIEHEDSIKDNKNNE